jgi:hypothetical protein
VTPFTLAEKLHVHPTPGGVYHAFSSAAHSPVKRMMRALLSVDTTPALTLDALKRWSEIDQDDQALALLHHAQKAGWVQGFQDPRRCPNQPIDQIVPGLLVKLSSQGKVLLADGQGFCLASCGFNHEVAEEVSALSADLANLHERRSSLLLNNMGLNSSAWAVVDASGGSKLGFWPLYIGDLRFVLAIGGMPRLNQPDFVKLIWILNRRYSATS